MKEIKYTRTIEEIVGYEASDGKQFKTEEECRKYENSAKYAIYDQFIRLSVNGTFEECRIWENYGYGSEDYNLIVVHIKDENDLKVANMFAEMQVPNTKNEEKNRFSSSLIGKKVLVAIGNDYDTSCYIYGTEDEIVDKFRNDIDKFFNPKEEETK